MKILICGAGRATRALLRSMGEGWDVTVVDSQSELESLITQFAAVQRVFRGDASSPVVLGRAGLEDHDWVLAFTSDDEVNLAIARFAREAGCKQVVGRYGKPEFQAALEAEGARAMSGVGALARDVVQHLRNPRVRTVPVAKGRGEVIEVEVGPRNSMIGQTPASLQGEPWALGAVFRDDGMLFPDDDITFREGDVLVIVGPPDQFGQVCSQLECAETNFPRSYGRSVLLLANGAENGNGVVGECMQYVQATMTDSLIILGQEDAENVSEVVAMWSQSVDIEVRPPAERPYRQVEELCEELSVGMAIVPWREPSLLPTFTRRSSIRLAHSLPCPLLIAKTGAAPKRILVPSTGVGNTGLALEIALQIAARTGAEVTAAVVQEPSFLRSVEEGEKWVSNALDRVRDIALGHVKSVAEEVREGNPVKEIIALAEDYDLIVLGSREYDSMAIFTPDVGEHIVNRAPCSVLVVTG